MSSPFPSCLPEYAAQSADGYLFSRMWNSNLSRFIKMFKLMVITFGMMKYPTILFQSFNDISTVHTWKIVGNPCQLTSCFSRNQAPRKKKPGFWFLGLSHHYGW